MPLPEKSFYKTQEIAERWDCHVDDILQWAADGKLSIYAHVNFQVNSFKIEYYSHSPSLDNLDEMRGHLFGAGVRKRVFARQNFQISDYYKIPSDTLALIAHGDSEFLEIEKFFLYNFSPIRIPKVLKDIDESKIENGQLWLVPTKAQKLGKTQLLLQFTDVQKFEEENGIFGENDCVLSPQEFEEIGLDLRSALEIYITYWKKLKNPSRRLTKDELVPRIKEKFKKRYGASDKVPAERLYTVSRPETIPSGARPTSTKPEKVPGWE